MRKLFIFFLLIPIFYLSISSCSKENDLKSIRLLSFGTYIDIDIYKVDSKKLEFIQSQLQSDFNLMHKAWHSWEPGPLGRINFFLREGKKVAAAPSVIPLLKISQRLAEKSNYLFDPGIGALVNIWGFHSNKTEMQKPPDSSLIKEWLDNKPSIRDIKINGFHISSKKKGVKLDFGAIGKGYGVDRAIESLIEMGVTDAIVNAGGDLKVIGSKAGNPWRIAIRNPEGNSPIAIIAAKDGDAIFTSGNYQRGFLWKNEWYHHLLDPRTGYPARGISSVTVIHKNAATADAAATAIFIAGLNDWHKIAKKMGVKYALIVDDKKNIYMNPKMWKRIEIDKQFKNLILSEPL